MGVRNGVIDNVRECFEEYLIEKNITAKEWFFIKNYIDQKFECIQNNVKLKE